MVLVISEAVNSTSEKLNTTNKKINNTKQQYQICLTVANWFQSAKVIQDTPLEN